ncbi:putative chromo domain protein [Phaeomoniella chlamydospora]|uniref:Putative chromo domain protein n=1 Tax=Phaeomoniella chlamydospora TaxID=158046 RepID=A0A0G2GCV5_PHACM|nr:putative chromo domain protein [Phaeomoniella chlamydospora]
MESDTDSNYVSITSSQESDQQAEYIVEQILSEKFDDDGQRLYLVKWLGYPDERATWEPSESFCDDTLRDWEEKCKHFDGGEHPDAHKVATRMHEYEFEKQWRRQRRLQKRKRLALAKASSAYITPYEESSSARQQLQSNEAVIDVSDDKVDSGTAEPIFPSKMQDKTTPQVKLTTSVTKSIPNAPAAKSGVFSGSEKPSAAASSSARVTGADILSKSKLAPESQSKASRKAKRKLDAVENKTGTTDTMGVPQPAIEQSTNASRSTTWLNDYTVGNKGNITAKRSKTTGPTIDAAVRRGKRSTGESAPNADTLKLEPAEDLEVAVTAKHFLPASGSASGIPRETDSASVRREQQKILEGGRMLKWTSVDAADRFLSKHHKMTTESFPSAQTPQTANWNGATNTPRAIIRAKNGRSFNWGEVLVHLLIGGSLVGATRFQGFEEHPWLLKPIIKTKTPDQPELHINFADVLCIEQFTQNYKGRSIQTYEIGKAIGFGDTQHLVAEAARRLAEEGRAAMWSPKNNKFTLILCSAESPEWTKLRQNKPVRFLKADLLLIATSYLPPPSTVASQSTAQITPSETEEPRMVDAREVQARPSTRTTTHQSAVIDPRSRPTPRRESLVSGESYLEDGSLEGQEHEPSLRSPAPCSPSPMGDIPGTTKQSAKARGKRKEHEENSEDVDLNIQFRKKYNITYEDLLKGLKLSSGKIVLFFLRFDKSHMDEQRTWRRFLEANDVLPNNIYESTDKKTWDAWKNLFAQLKTAKAVIIMHTSLRYRLDDLTELSEVLRRLVSVFSVTSKSPATGRGQLFQQLFPLGGAILLTEATMVEYPVQSLEIVVWFSEKIRNKRKGTWTLFLPPSIFPWLQTKGTEANDPQLAAQYMQIYVYVRHMVPEEHRPVRMDGDSNSDAIGLNRGFDQPDDLGPIISPARLNWPRDPTEAEDSLVKLFAGWTLRESHSFRTLYVVSPRSLLQWKDYTWVRALSPIHFCKENKVVSETPKGFAVTVRAKSTTKESAPEEDAYASKSARKSKKDQQSPKDTAMSG